MAFQNRFASFLTEIISNNPQEEQPTKSLDRMDRYTHKFEIEKRKGESLDDKIKVFRENILNRQDELNGMLT